MSRSFAYVHHRPGHYAAYVALAWAVGTVGLAFVDVFAGLVVRPDAVGLSFGAPRGLLAGLFGSHADVRRAAGRRLPRLLALVGRLLVHGWVYSYFWPSAAIIYLLLRRDVDGTPWHECRHRRTDRYRRPETTPRRRSTLRPKAEAPRAVA